MTALSRLDYEILAVAFGAMLLLGLAATRLASRGLDHYYLGGRSLPWYVLGVSGMSGWFDLTGTMIITSFLYIMGPRGLYIEFRGGAVLVLAFILAFTGKWARRSGCMTSAEWNSFRFGTGPSAELVRGVSAAMGIFTVVGSLAFLVRGATFFMGVMFPVNPIWLTFAIVVFASLYTILAGFYGMVFNDLLQGAIMITGCILLTVIAWRHVPNVAVLAETARRVTGNAHWTEAAPAWQVAVPAGYEAYRCLIMAALFYLLRNIFGGLGTFLPLSLAARSPREASQLSLIQALTVMFRWPFMIAFAVLGIFTVSRMMPRAGAAAETAIAVHAALPGLNDNDWAETVSRIAHHPEEAPPGLAEKLGGILGPDWKSRLLLVGQRGTVNPELILPAVVLFDLKPGLRGFILVVLFSALMGALAAMINTGSAYFVRDIYQNFFRTKARNRELILAAYLSSFAIVAIGFPLGLHATSINELWAWYVMSLTGGAVGPFALRLYWWRTNAWGMASGLIVGGLAAFWQRAYYPGMPEFWQFALMGSLSFAATIAGSLLTKPLPVEVVRNFHDITRPFGFWKPFRDKLPQGVRQEWKREHRNDLLSLAFALVWQVCLFLLPMLVVIHNGRAFFTVLPLLLVSATGLYLFWWKNLPSPDERVPDFAGRAPVHSLRELKTAEENRP